MALGLAEEMRAAFRLPKINFSLANPDWNQERFFRDKKSEIETRRKRDRLDSQSDLIDMNANTERKQ